MKYKYKLVENEEPTTNGGGEESGLRRMNIPKELKLTTHGNVTADDIIRILEDPKYFSDAFIYKPDDLKDFERKVFGDKPTSDKFINTNKTIYDENGIKLYNEIENSVKDRFERKDFIIKKDKSNKTIFAFPIKNKKHQDLVVAYLNVKPKTHKINDNIKIRYATVTDIITAFDSNGFELSEHVRNSKNGDILESYICNWQKTR